MTGIDNLHFALVFIFFQHHVLGGIVASIQILFSLVYKIHEATIWTMNPTKCNAFETTMKFCSINYAPSVLDLEATMVKYI